MSRGDFVCTSANDGTHLFRPVSARAHTFWQSQNYNKFVIDNTEAVSYTHLRAHET